MTNYPLFNFPPASGVDTSTSTLAPYFLDWLAHPTYDDYWKKLSIEEHFADINVPILHIAAWYDIFQDGSMRNYLGIKAHGGDNARKGQHLLVMIGGHAGSGRKIGDVDFGDKADFSEEETILTWYDYLFKGVQNEFAGKPVKIFVMGANQWREEDDWPLARAKSTKYFLHSSGKANSLRGDGTLSTTASRAESADQYVYDPANPAPTTGGPLCCDANHQKAGPLDQRPVEAREDVLVYSTPPFSQDTEITGQVALELYAKSSAVDTDFTGKLVDVWPDGFAQNLTEGIIRARYRDSTEKATLLNPGQVYKFNIDLWSTSNVFKKGHVSASGSFQQQLPALRPQSEYGRANLNRTAFRFGDQYHLSRCRTSVGSHIAGCANAVSGGFIRGQFVQKADSRSKTVPAAGFQSITSTLKTPFFTAN